MSFLRCSVFWRRQGALILLIGFLSSCAVFSFSTYYDSFVSGDLKAAEEKLEEIPQKDKNQALIKMHYAILRQIEGKFEESNRYLEEAKRLGDQLAPLSLSESATALAVNEAVRSYSGSIFERLMVFVYKYMNYLALGQYNEARIEMRQAELQLSEWGLEAKSYPYIPLLLALAYEGLGREDDALVAYRRALGAYDNEQVPKLLVQSYLNLLARMSRRSELEQQEALLGMRAERDLPATSLIVLSPAGQVVSRRRSISIYHPHPVALQDFLISIPVYGNKPPIPRSPSVRIGDMAMSFELLIDVEQEMRDALAEDTPILILRALARALIQHELQEEVDEQQDSTLSSIISAGRIISSSVADTRSWDSLPSTLHISRLSLAPGNYTFFVDIDAVAATALQLNAGTNFFMFFAR